MVVEPPAHAGRYPRRLGRQRTLAGAHRNNLLAAFRAFALALLALYLPVIVGVCALILQGVVTRGDMRAFPLAIERITRAAGARRLRCTR
jgi:hypothetical protein